MRTGKVTIAEGLQRGKAIALTILPVVLQQKKLVRKLQIQLHSYPSVLWEVHKYVQERISHPAAGMCERTLRRTIKLKVCFPLPPSLHKPHINLWYHYFLQSFRGFSQGSLSLLVGLHQQAIMLAVEVT